jgi:nucleotide-binding universal stress UspA family protein
MFKPLLVPVDGSELSLRAVDTDIALAAKPGADIHALHVLPSISAAEVFAVVAQATEKVCRELGIARTERVFSKVCQRAQAAGVLCTASDVVDRRPACGIDAAVAKYHCDLVVMATHGWRGMKRLLVGSVTQEVLLISWLPVLVCR